jgi:hypothetical protein
VEGRRSTDEILDLIDEAIEDTSVSPDAMRVAHSPDPDKVVVVEPDQLITVETLEPMVWLWPGHNQPFYVSVTEMSPCYCGAPVSHLVSRVDEVGESATGGWVRLSGGMRTDTCGHHVHFRVHGQRCELLRPSPE